VSSAYLRFIRWKRWMQEHVVLRELRKVAPVTAYRHFIEWKPAILRLAEVADKRDLMMNQIFHNWIEPRVVDHNELAVRVAQFHSNTFPYFHGYGTGSTCLLDMGDRGIRPVLVFPVVEREMTGKGKFIGIIGQMHLGGVLLIFQRREPGCNQIDAQ